MISQMVSRTAIDGALCLQQPTSSGWPLLEECDPYRALTGKHVSRDIPTVTVQSNIDR